MDVEGEGVLSGKSTIICSRYLWDGKNVVEESVGDYDVRQVKLLIKAWVFCYTCWR